MTLPSIRTKADILELADAQANLLNNQTRGKVNAAQSFRFVVEVEGIISAYFTQVTGISMEREVKEYAEGGTNDFVYKFPGRTKWTNITLHRGITLDHFVWDWFSTGLYDGKVKRMNFTILLSNANLLEIKRWNVYDAFPVKWTGADLAADSLQVAVETLELAHHGMSLDLTNSGKPIAAGVFSRGAFHWNSLKATVI